MRALIWAGSASLLAMLTLSSPPATACDWGGWSGCGWLEAMGMELSVTMARQPTPMLRHRSTRHQPTVMRQRTMRRLRSTMHLQSTTQAPPWLRICRQGTTRRRATTHVLLSVSRIRNLTVGEGLLLPSILAGHEALSRPPCLGVIRSLQSKVPG